MTKVHLILVDGMRPDALAKCSNPFIADLLSRSMYSLHARTVYPSMTLPCHMSLIHSVGPERHGVTTNTYTPQVRPIRGLFEMLHPSKTTAFCYNWEELRDLNRPGSLGTSCFFSLDDLGGGPTNEMITCTSEKLIETRNPDFLFTYLGWVDDRGHNCGWMSDEYLAAIDSSFSDIERIMKKSDEETVTIITADHGGHDRNHGTLDERDMTIPIIINGPGIPAGETDRPMAITDIAPTITKLLGCSNAPEWEGASIL